ncbi:MAG TPA: hypothetical protein VF865_19350 [Acidobacteriaceae bacterium]
MGAIILLAALSLALSEATSLCPLLLAQTPYIVPPAASASTTATGILTTAAPDITNTQLALLPDAPLPVAAAVVIAPVMTIAPTPNPYTPFLNSTAPAPLTPKQKALLAFHNFKDPGNLASVAYTSAIAIGTDAHTAYGPGWKGFGENFGYRLVRDATAEVVGTFLIPSITHEDPRYHRMPDASAPRRVLHAVSRTVIAQSDTGKLMPNYATLLGTPIRAEIANLYIPGVRCNLPGTAERVLTSYAENPIDNLVTEFLPDVAKHVHLHVLFAQRLLNQATGSR